MQSIAQNMVRSVHDSVVDDGLGHKFYFFSFYFSPSHSVQRSYTSRRPFHFVSILWHNLLYNLHTFKEKNE